MKRNIFNIVLISIFLLSLLPTSFVNAVTTDTTTTSVVIQSGSLSITSPQATIDFGTIVVDGTVKKPTASLSNLSMSDFTGTSDGWKVTVQATPFTQTNGSRLLSLSPGILTLKPGITINPDGNTNVSPTVMISSNSLIDTGSAVEIISASAGAGEGAWSASFPATALELAIDTSKPDLVESGVSPTTYESVITWTISTGP